MPKRIDKTTEDKIKAAANIVDVVGDFVELRRSGINWKGMCPFHDDHTPSLTVSPKRNIYKCFVCGEGGNSIDFLMRHPQAKLSYPDALRYLAKKYSIWIDEDQQDNQRWQNIKPAKPRTIEDAKPLELLTIDRAIVKRTTDLRDQNTFVRWVRSLPWGDIERARVNQTLWQYCVGHFKKDSRTVFWQIDEQGRVHTGKLMMYDDRGKRIREGAFKNPGWAHNYLKYDKNRFGMQQCLFGMHLIDRFPEMPVNIVESEKTAIICAIQFDTAYGLWMACGGLQSIKDFELQPLIDRKRKIYLWPDKDGKDGWAMFAESIDYADLRIHTDFLDKNWREEDGPKGDVADIIVRLWQHPESVRQTEAKESQGATAKSQEAVLPLGANPDPLLSDEQLELLGIQEWTVEHPDDTFTDPEEFANPELHRRREVFRRRYNFNKSRHEKDGDEDNTPKAD